MLKIFSSFVVMSLLTSSYLAAGTSFKPIVALSDGAATEQVANPTFKIGTMYSVKGVKYTPFVWNDYDSIGNASWYGNEFHGRLTANGEIFDKNQITAAHPTLPLPSIVEVTNLDNGKKLIIRVNDRGPFEGNREIDVSEKAAEMLGFLDKGVARVRVVLLKDISDQVASYVKNGTEDKKNSSNDLMAKNNVSNKNKLIDDIDDEDADEELVSSLSNSSNNAPGYLAVNGKKPEENVDGNHSDSLVDKKDIKPISLQEPTTVRSYLPRGIFVQVGAYTQDNKQINSAMKDLSTIGVVTLQKVDINGQSLLRLRVGPYNSIEDANKAKQNLLKIGYTSSRVIIEE
jgi:rare lipoprotein A